MAKLSEFIYVNDSLIGNLTFGIHNSTYNTSYVKDGQVDLLTNV